MELRTAAHLLVLVAVSSGCGPTSYMRATGAYSVAVKAGTEAFGAEFEAALVQCHRREQLDRARHLMEGSNNKDIDWASHCKDIENAIELHRRSTDQVTAFASALSTLAGGTKYDGDGPKNAAAGTSALIETFAGKTSNEAKYAAASAEPLKLLAGFVLNQYASVNIKKAIEESSLGLRLMLKAMTGYLEGSKVQLLVYEGAVKQFLKDATALLRGETAVGVVSPRKVPPLDAIQFVRESELLTTELDTAHTRHQALEEVLTKLEAAEAKLEKAGERDEKELSEVVSSAVEVGKAVKTVLDAVKE